MPRTRYDRKREAHRAWIAALWRNLHPFLEPASPRAANPDLSGLRRDLSEEQIAELRGTLAELGEQFRIGLGVAQLPEDPPPFFAIGAEMPASRIGTPSPLLQHFLRPKGRPRKHLSRPSRPDQAEVDAWMRKRAAVAFVGAEHALKQDSAVAECMAATQATRAQARVAFSRLPSSLRRERGQHDRWVKHDAHNPDA